MDDSSNKLTYEELEKKNKQLEGLLVFQEEKRRCTIGARIPTCQLCFDPVECPVTLNNNNSGKCPASQSNPSCLLCVRTWLDNMRTQNKNTFPCLWKCCDMSNKGYITYGELGRKPDDVAEPTLYRMMGSEGVTQCTRCHTDCVTVYNLAQHIKTSCPLRKIKCSTCKKMMLAEEMQKHEETCYYKCQYCGDKLPSVLKTETIQHLCKKKPIYSCKYCDVTFCIETLLDNYNNGNLHNCCKLYKNESIPSSMSQPAPHITDYQSNNRGSVLTQDNVSSRFGSTVYIDTRNP